MWGEEGKAIISRFETAVVWWKAGYKNQLFFVVFFVVFFFFLYIFKLCQQPKSWMWHAKADMCAVVF